MQKSSACSITFRFLLLTVLLLVMPLSAHAETPVKIGIVAPISQEFAKWGEGITRGATLAAEENNFSLEIADEEFCKSNKALTAVQDMLSKGITIIMVSCLNGLHAVQPLVERKGAVLLSAGLTEELQKSERVVSLSGQVTDEALFLAKYLQKESIIKVHSMRVDDNFTAAFMQVFKKQAGLQVVKDDAVVPGGASFGSLLLSTRSLQPQIRYVSLGNDQMSELLKARTVYHDTVPLLGQYTIESNPLPLDQRKLLEGTKYSYPNLGDAAGRQEFEATFRKKFGEAAVPTVNSYFIYDGLVALRAAINGCKSDTASDCILNTLRDGKLRQGVGGSFTYTESGTVLRDFVLKTVKDGMFVTVSE